MRSKKRKIVFAVVVALLVLGLVDACGAIPLRAQQVKVAAGSAVTDEATASVAVKAPIALVHKGTGFALDERSDEFHVLRVQIVRVRRVRPAEVRELIESEKTLAEIKAEFMAQESESLYKGHLRLGNHHYRLENISLSAAEAEGKNHLGRSHVSSSGSRER